MAVHYSLFAFVAHYDFITIVVLLSSKHDVGVIACLYLKDEALLVYVHVCGYSIILPLANYEYVIYVTQKLSSG